MERADLIRLARATGVAAERGDTVFLCDPKWGEAERGKFKALRAETGDRGSEIGWLGIATGGSSGGLKFARHDERTLGAAAEGFRAHFGLARVNAVDVLPAHHVSGFMARVRCAISGGEHRAWDWKRLEAGGRPAVAGGDWVISLVPTQLQRLLASAEATDWLRRFAVIFLGGGPVWPALAEAAAEARLRVSLSYGMTETAAMVTALRPEEFLAGARSSGAALPHARVTIDAEGLVRLAGESVFRGYYPERRTEREFTTADLGRIDERGHLHVLGRADAAIITGGEKVQPQEVEAALRASGEFADVAVIGVPDPEWGQSVVACYPRAGRGPEVGRVEASLRELSAFKRPKRFIAIASAIWPRNAQGKLNRAELARLARASDHPGAG